MFKAIKDLELQSLINFFENKKNIDLVIVFGSVAKGMAQANSDLDLAIKMKGEISVKEKLELISSITQLNGRAIDLLDLSNVGEPILGQVIKHGVLLKGSRLQVAKLAIKNIYENEDFLPYIERSLKKRIEMRLG